MLISIEMLQIHKHVCLLALKCREDIKTLVELNYNVGKGGQDAFIYKHAEIKCVFIA